MPLSVRLSLQQEPLTLPGVATVGGEGGLVHHHHLPLPALQREDGPAAGHRLIGSHRLEEREQEDRDDDHLLSSTNRRVKVGMYDGYFSFLLILTAEQTKDKVVLLLMKGVEKKTEITIFGNFLV